MTKLSWGAPGERFFETGIDRGVVFVDNVGYAWSGLVSVSEKSSGGDLQEYYLDGVKYAQVMTSEDYTATVEALSAPREFLECDGSFELYNGLIVTQQRRKEFGFSYRSLVGNDIDGTDLGYKLHIVYNALAAPNEKTYQTKTSSSDVQPLSWEISTVPNAVSGIRPTAHFVVDSRRSSLSNINELEDLLYGTDLTTPSLPSVSALIAIFA